MSKYHQLSHVNHHILVHAACLVFSTRPITPKTTTLNEGGVPQNLARNQEDLHLSLKFEIDLIMAKAESIPCNIKACRLTFP